MLLNKEKPNGFCLPPFIMDARVKPGHDKGETMPMPHVTPTLTWDHIHLRTPDPEATAQWFERMLGAQVSRSMQAGKPRIDLTLGGANIFLAQVSPRSEERRVG